MLWYGRDSTTPPPQFLIYLVAVVLDFVSREEKVCASEFTVMFGWMMFSEIIGKIVLNSSPVYKIVDLSDSVTNPI